MTTYSVSYAIPTTATATLADTLRALAESPATLEDVVETCRELEVDATLRDEPGSVRGWVRADGSYRLA